RHEWFEELRFAKKQQWYIATAAVTLLAAILALQHAGAPEGLQIREKVAFGVAITLVATFACSFLLSLKKIHTRDAIASGPYRQRCSAPRAEYFGCTDWSDCSQRRCGFVFRRS